MTQAKYDGLLAAIRSQLSSRLTKAKKEFCYGYIFGLLMYNVIDMRIYTNLCETINRWQKGDTNPRISPITDL